MNLTNTEHTFVCIIVETKQEPGGTEKMKWQLIMFTRGSFLLEQHKNHYSFYIFYFSFYHLIQVPVGGVAPCSID